jgi:hypothetical protein
MLATSEGAGALASPLTPASSPPQANCGGYPSVVPLFPRTGDVIASGNAVPFIVEVLGVSNMTGAEGSLLSFDIRNARGIRRHLDLVRLTTGGSSHFLIALSADKLDAADSPFQLEVQLNETFNGCQHQETDVLAKFDIH